MTSNLMARDLFPSYLQAIHGSIAAWELSFQLKERGDLTFHEGIHPP